MKKDLITGLLPSRDLRLPAWGPYSKRYAGISHVADPDRGLRFDLCVFPSLYRRRLAPPHLLWEGGERPWEAAADLSYYAFRHVLEDGRIWGDCAFYGNAPDQREIRVALTNRSRLSQGLALHLVAACMPPEFNARRSSIWSPAVVRTPASAVWLDALTYARLAYRQPDLWDSCMPDGLVRGEIRCSGSVGGSVLGTGFFGRTAGDQVDYEWKLEAPLRGATLAIRYRTPGDAPAIFESRGLFDGRLVLPPAHSFGVHFLALGDCAAGTAFWRLCSTGAGAVELDGYVLGPDAAVRRTEFADAPWDPVPRIETGPVDTSRILTYPGAPRAYGLRWDGEESRVREVVCRDLHDFLRIHAHEHVAHRLRGEGEGHYTQVMIQPIVMAPGETRVFHARVGCGSRQTLEPLLADPLETDTGFRRFRRRRWRCRGLREGRPGRNGQERMAAVTLTNVVYPQFLFRRPVLHNTPGRWWDCFYTWDSGFLGLGLAELDVQRAVDCLHMYCSEDDERQPPFLHHGSPVPVQVYLYQDLCNRTQSRELMERFYPRLRRWYRFLSGAAPGSRFNDLSSDLLRPWDYFYNSGGWDDYPAQQYVRQQGWQARVTPVVTTAQAIRMAKILEDAAEELGVSEDVALYRRDIERFSRALQRHAWDAESGYFSYVVHDAAGHAHEILRHPGGENYNRGLDGVHPLVADVCDADQVRALCDNLFDPGGLWTPVGLTTVDRRAVYYRKDGYWNGTVWFPHQWFVWKAMLDQNRVDAAVRIARTALDVWKRETDASGYCYEHFPVETGRGGGWHAFSGLSCPILAWYNALYQPGRLTVGLNTGVDAIVSGPRRICARLRLKGTDGKMSAVLAVLDTAGTVAAHWNGAAMAARVVQPGLVAVTVPARGRGELTIQS